MTHFTETYDNTVRGFAPLIYLLIPFLYQLIYVFIPLLEIGTGKARVLLLQIPTRQW